MTLVQTSVKIEVWQLEAAKLANLNLSHLLRTAVDAALNSNDDLDKEESEIQSQKAILAAREEMFSVRKQRSFKKESEELQDNSRRKWLQSNQNYIEAYQKGTLGSRAWQTLNRELKFSSKRQTEEYLQKISAEYSLDWHDVRQLVEHEERAMPG